MSKRALVVGVVLLAWGAGCAPGLRRDVGAGGVLLGAITSSVALSAMAPCAFHETDPQPHFAKPCDPGQPPPKGLDPDIAFPMLFTGLSTMVLGGILFGTGSHTSGPVTQLPIQTASRRSQTQHW